MAILDSFTVLDFDCDLQAERFSRHSQKKCLLFPIWLVSVAILMGESFKDFEADFL